jgi:hypothetical protein
VPARTSLPGVTMLSAHGIKVLAANLDIAGLAPAAVVCLLGGITILLIVIERIPLIHCVLREPAGEIVMTAQRVP